MRKITCLVGLVAGLSAAPSAAAAVDVVTLADSRVASPTPRSASAARPRFVRVQAERRGSGDRDVGDRAAEAALSRGYVSSSKSPRIQPM